MAMEVDENHHHHHGEDELASPPLPGPLVFQCLHCFSIIGDSYAMSFAIQELGAIILVGATNIREGSKLLTSKNGYDMGCSFRTITCSNCNMDLGRVYKSTSKALDAARELYTFFTEKLKSYEVGSVGLGNAAAPMADPVHQHHAPAEEAAAAEPEAAAEAEPEAADAAEGAPETNAKHLLEEEHNRIREILDAQGQKMEQHEAALAEHSALLEKQNTLLESVKEQQASIEKQLKATKADLSERIVKLEQQAAKAPSASSVDQATQNEISLLRQKLTDLDTSMSKVKTLWVNFDDRVKSLEAFTGSIIAPFATGHDSAMQFAGAVPEMDVDLDPSANSDGSDGKRGQKRKR